MRGINKQKTEIRVNNKEEKRQSGKKGKGMIKGDGERVLKSWSNLMLISVISSY